MAQTLTVVKASDYSPEVINKGADGVFKPGIYSGMEITVEDVNTARIETGDFILADSDAGQTVKGKLEADELVGAEESSPYFVIRWSYADAMTADREPNNLAEFDVVSSPGVDDVVIGKGEFSSGDLTGIDTTERDERGSVDGEEDVLAKIESHRTTEVHTEPQPPETHASTHEGGDDAVSGPALNDMSTAGTAGTGVVRGSSGEGNFGDDAGADTTMLDLLADTSSLASGYLRVLLGVADSNRHFDIRYETTNYGTSNSTDLVIYYNETDPATEVLRLPADGGAPIHSDATASNESATLGQIESQAANTWQAVKTNTASTSSTTFSAITGLSVTLTPQSTDDAFLVIADLTVSNANDGDNGGYAVLQRDGTTLVSGDSAGTRNGVHLNLNEGEGSNSIQASQNGKFVDTPNTTNSITYSVAWRQNTDRTGTTYLNRTDGDVDHDGHERTVSTLTVIRVNNQ